MTADWVGSQETLPEEAPDRQEGSGRARTWPGRGGSKRKARPGRPRWGLTGQQGPVRSDFQARVTALGTKQPSPEAQSNQTARVFLADLATHPQSRGPPSIVGTVPPLHAEMEAPGHAGDTRTSQRVPAAQGLSRGLKWTDGKLRTSPARAASAKSSQTEWAVGTRWL